MESDDVVLGADVPRDRAAGGFVWLRRDRLDCDRHGANPVCRRARAVRDQPVRRLSAAQLLERSLRRLEMGTQPVTRGIAGGAVPAIHDGHPKAAGWHGVSPRRQLFMECNLYAGHARGRCNGTLHVARRMVIAEAVRYEQDNAVSGARSRIVEAPLTSAIEPDDRLHPARPIKIGPLIGEAQMHFDDSAADCLQVEQPRITLEMPTAPGTAPF